MTPELRITVLMENTAREGLEAEHGLLRHRLALMAQSRAGLNGLEAEGAHHQDVAQLRQQLADNEAALAAAHSGSGWLEATLEQLQAHLAAAQLSCHKFLLGQGFMRFHETPPNHWDRSYSFRIFHTSLK